MMKNSAFAFASLVFSFSFASGALAQTPASPILSATQHSGYTTAEAATEDHCELSPSGQATGYHSSGWNGTGWTNTTPISFAITPSALTQLEASIAIAKTGPIQTAPGQCDAPTIEIDAQVAGDTQNFVVISVPDCAPGARNINPSAQDLRVWVAKLCKIAY
jgi:hypothetical protein